MSPPGPDSTIQSLQASRRVFARFVLVRRLGAGGMGEVWLAHDESLAVDVCLKFLPEYIRWSPAALVRHRAEALRARALGHPHIVRVFDFLEDAALAAIMMEFVDGRTLAAERLLHPAGVMSPPEIAGWLPQLADALDYLHSNAKVVHGDLKPSNVLLRADGLLKLADFGVARELKTQGDTNLGGTLPYLSPQRVLGAAPTPADDVYALGVLLYEMLTGRPPFSEGDVAAQVELLPPEGIEARRQRIQPPPRESIPRQAEQTIMACLAKNPAARPGSAGEVARAWAAGPPPLRPRRRTVALAGAALLLAAAGTALWWPHFSRPPTLQRPPPHPIREYTEDFESGLAGWVRWGSPAPRTLHEYQGRIGVFDNNGDGTNPSGATSTAVLAAPGGFDLSCDVRLDLSNPAGSHLHAIVGLTWDPAAWVDALGSKGDFGDAVRIGIGYSGDSTWGSEIRRHADLDACFVKDDATRLDYGSTVPIEQRFADHLLGRWITFRIVVTANREIRFYCDGRLFWAPAERVHPRVLAGQRLVVLGRSAASAGKAYHDNLVLRASPGATLRLVAAPPVSRATHESLPWNDATWAQNTIGGAARVAWPANGDPLLLSTPDNGTLALRTRRPLPAFPIAEFELQPFLNTGGRHPDVLTVYLEHGATGRWIRWGAQFRGTEVWLVERDPDGNESDVVRAGTYAPGAWATFVISRTAGGAMELIGSRIRPQCFRTRPAADGTWVMGAELSSSSDGAALRPPCVTSAR